MKEYVIDLNQDEVGALYIITGYISGPVYNKNLRTVTSRIYHVVEFMVPDRRIYNYADGGICSTVEDFIPR